MADRNPNQGLPRRLLSHVRPQILEERSTPHNPLLAVVEIRGKLQLDGLTVNYSCGSLENVLREAFEALELERRPIESVLLLGFGAGSAVRLLRASHGGQLRFVAVEIDPVVIELARKWFGFDRDASVELVNADAVEFAARDDRSYDLVLVDAFVDDVVPKTLREAGFMHDLRARLARDGVLVFNTLTDTRQRRAECAEVESALLEAFEAVERLEIRTNRVFAAFER
jgi:spermidine synthase